MEERVQLIAQLMRVLPKSRKYPMKKLLATPTSTLRALLQRLQKEKKTKQR